MARTRSARRRLAPAVLALAAMLGLAACNTIAGAGRDLESLGRTLADSAERARP
jgi:predicted small secreted protein